MTGGTSVAVVTLESIRKPIGEGPGEIGMVDLGPMSVISHKIPKGSDFTELLRAACGDILCPVPHYFVIGKGVLGIRYLDGREEIARAGDVAYTPPGHTVWAIEDVEATEITAAEGNNWLFGRINELGLLG